MATDTSRESVAQRIRRLPPNERDAILAAAAQAAEQEYRRNAELTSFEAYGKDDLYGDSSDSDIASAIAMCVGAP